MTTPRAAIAKLRKADRKRGLLGLARDAFFDTAPLLAAIVAFVIGGVALIDAATPKPHIPGLAALAADLGELPELTASICGIALMALAVGLRRRLDAALVAAIALMIFFAAYALFHREHLPAAALCLAGVLFLLGVRRAFYRKAGLSALAPSRPLYLAIAVVLVIAAIAGVLWASEKPGFDNAPWWALITGPRIGRPGRVLAAALFGLVLIGIWHAFLAPARKSPAAPSQDETDRARILLAGAEQARPEIQLALLGDKSFIFSPDKSAFVMTARAGGSLVAMGAPVGAHAAWRDALTELRNAAESSNLRPVVYAAPPDLLPELIDLGFRMEKIGENAIVDLHKFSLDGKAKQDLRTARRRLAEREGAVFEIVRPPLPEPLLPSLEPVSQAWLAVQSGSEKGFSLGRFDPRYLANFPVAVVRLHGAPLAFANIWTTPERAYASIDLMRYDPKRAIPGLMDFLICEILIWAQREGFAKFDLGMAPLSGLANERHSPLFQRLGRIVYEEGSAFYGFESLRKFKDKFAPVWEPRYLAAPGTWSMPIVLAEIALLTSRGARGLFLKTNAT